MHTSPVSPVSVAFALVCFTVLPLHAGDVQPPFDRGLDLIRAELAVAATGLRALSIAAHPDDEDGGTLSYLRRTLGVETHLCQVTRGEGGQNEAGPETGADLAVVRTRETEKSAAILGVKVWYMNQTDFGFSRNPDEAFKVWGRDKALGEMVRIIRITRPHIIFMNHDPDGNDHGHHVAAGKLALEAFDAAADPQKFAEQMAADGTQPWKTLKLFVRRFAPVDATHTFDISLRDPLTGISSSQIAAYALSMHVSQGMLRESKPGERDMRYFKLLKSHLPAGEKEKSLFEGIPATGAPVAVPASIATIDDGSLATAIVAAYKPLAADHPARAHLTRALVETLGLSLTATAKDDIANYGEEVAVNVRVANAGGRPIQLKQWQMPAEPKWKTAQGEPKLDIAPRSFAEIDTTVTPETGAYPTWPPAEYLRGRIESRTSVRAAITFTLAGDATEFTHSVNVPIELAPPLALSAVPNPLLVFDDPAHDDNFLVLAKFRLAVTNHRNLKEPLKLFAGIIPKDNVPVDKTATLQFSAQDETLSDEFRLMVPVEQLNRGDVAVTTGVWDAEKTFATVDLKIRRVPLKLPQPLVVGLVKTYDDSVEAALRRLEAAGLGLTVTLLSPDDLRTADLNKLHTIILDVRATQYRPEVRRVRERLNQFMNDGGNVLCLYHKDFDWNDAAKDQPVRGAGIFKGTGGGGELAPFPIELSFNRVTDETAPVRILTPQHPLLLEPCKIWERDFEGWVQERGIYFPKNWPPQYTPLLSSNDPGQPALDGGLLVGEVGRGSFIYCAYALHRQLRAGVPGGYRLLANLISYPRVKRK